MSEGIYFLTEKILLWIYVFRFGMLSILSGRKQGYPFRTLQTVTLRKKKQSAAFKSIIYKPPIRTAQSIDLLFLCWKTAGHILTLILFLCSYPLHQRIFILCPYADKRNNQWDIQNIWNLFQFFWCQFLFTFFIGLHRCNINYFLLPNVHIMKSIASLHYYLSEKYYYCPSYHQFLLTLHFSM